MAIAFAYDPTYQPPAPVVEVLIRAASEATGQALLDSGADGTMTPITMLRQIRARFARTHKMRGVLGHALVVELYFVEVQIDSHRIPGIKAIAAESTAEIIIGRDVLRHLVVTLDGIAGLTEIS
jgi:predicted aspartyl protease